MGKTDGVVNPLLCLTGYQNNSSLYAPSKKFLINSATAAQKGKVMKETIKSQVKDILEIVTFIKDNSASKQDLNDLRMATKQDLTNLRIDLCETLATKEELQNVKSDLIGHIDGLARQVEKFDGELTAKQGLIDRHENHIKGLAKHIGFNLSEIV
ncbi:hypothetical protein HY224_00355 [Candidatus Uhrbacteria bacterium]|nr:hypothetical protein [Candidatus Uhrbacteria bacterium]